MRFGLLFHHILRYAQVGVLNAVVDLGAYWLLTDPLGVHPLAANIVSRALGGVTGFVLNKYWTFGNRGTRTVGVELGKFWLVFGVSMAASEALVGLLYSVLGMPAMASKMIAEGILFVFNFAALRHWVYR